MMRYDGGLDHVEPQVCYLRRTASVSQALIKKRMRTMKS